MERMSLELSETDACKSLCTMMCQVKPIRKTMTQRWLTQGSFRYTRIWKSSNKLTCRVSLLRVSQTLLTVSRDLARESSTTASCRALQERQLLILLSSYWSFWMKAIWTRNWQSLSCISWLKWLARSKLKTFSVMHLRGLHPSSLWSKAYLNQASLNKNHGVALTVTEWRLRKAR